MQQQIPTVNRSVHYLDPISGVAGATVPRAAIIVEVLEAGNPASAVALHVFRPHNVDGKSLSEVKSAVPFGSAAGSWCWPPFAPAVSKFDGRLGPQEETPEQEKERAARMADMIKAATTPAPGEKEALAAKGSEG
jgi:hypothetical protein